MLKKKNNIFIISGVLITLLSFSCHQNHNNDSETEKIYPLENDLTKAEEYDAHEKVINYGDTEAYDLLTSRYLDYRIENYLYLDLVMANKYNYKPAYYGVYQTLTWSFKDKGSFLKEKMGKGNYNMAIEYLKKGAILGDTFCIETINESYPELKKEIMIK